METERKVGSISEVLEFQRQGKTWEAMKSLKRLAAEQPDKAFHSRMLGNLYFHMGVLDWAIEYYQRAIEVDPNYIDAHYDLGVASYHRGRVQDAIRSFQRVLSLDPNYHAAHYRIAICYLHTNQFNVAAQHFAEVIAITPEYAMAHFHLGVIYFKQQAYNKAKHEFMHVLRQNPDDVACASYLELIGKQMGREEVIVVAQL